MNLVRDNTGFVGFCPEQKRRGQKDDAGMTLINLRLKFLRKIGVD